MGCRRTFTPSLLALAAGLLQFPVARSEDLLFAAMELVTRRDVAQRTVQTLVVVPRDESFPDPPGVLQRQGRLRLARKRLAREVDALTAV